MPVLYLPYFQHARSVGEAQVRLPDAESTATRRHLGYITGDTVLLRACSELRLHVLRPNILSQQGLLWQGEWRHRLRMASTTVKVAGIDQDANDLPAAVE